MYALPRLVYLAVEHKPTLPPKRLMKMVTMGPLIQTLSSKGISGAQAELDMPREQLMSLYEDGKRMGRGSEEEFRITLSQEISAEIDLRRDTITLTDYWHLVSMINEYANGKNETLIDTAEASLTDVPAYTPINKWSSGFEPLDLVMNDFYQGIFIMLGYPGSGKTSLCMTLMEMMRFTNQASSVWFYQTEIPLGLMLYRNMPSRQRVKFLPDDRIICGLPTMQDIIERVQESPDPNRVIIIDSPDVMAGGSSDGRRFAIEDDYRQLVKLKGMCKAVFVPSQGRRSDRELGLTSTAEAFAKAFYADGMLTIQRLGPGVNNWSRVRVKGVKNRFGPVDRAITFAYNYETLEFQLDDEQRQAVNGGGNDGFGGDEDF